MKLSRFSVIVFSVFATFFLKPAVHPGDKQDDQELFDKVTARLEQGGSYYNFQSSKYIFRSIEKTYLRIPEAIKIVVPEPQDQIVPMIVYDCLKPVIRSFGIDELLAVGAGSVVIAEKTRTTPTLFRSRQFIYHGDRQVKGLIWDLAAGENRPLDLAALPKETLFACKSQGVPGKVWSKIKLIFARLPFPEGQNIPLMAEQNFLAKTNVELTDFLDSLNGSYSSVIMSGKDNEGKPVLYGMLKIPDKKKMVFKVLAKTAKSIPSLQVLQNEISIKNAQPVNWLKPVIRQEGENVYIMSNKKILNIMRDSAAKKNGLVSTPEFKFLSRELPMEGIAFCYFNSRTVKEIVNIIKSRINQDEKDWSVFAEMLPPSDFFLTAAKEKDGIMLTANSPIDIPQLITYSSVMPSLLQFIHLLPVFSESRSKVLQAGCTNNLEKIDLALKMYAMNNKDKYPAANNAAGLNELVKNKFLTDMSTYVCPNSTTVKAAGPELKEANSSYIYIGGFTEGDGANIPMALDKFDNNKNIVNVLFQDGYVRTMPERFSSCTELIRHLAKTSAFKPEILKKLRERAAQIDRELGYK